MKKLWQVTPGGEGSGKCNTLTADDLGDGKWTLTLRVEKPGIAVEGTVTLDCTGGQLERSVSDLSPTWQGATLQDQNGIYRAVRYFSVAGTPLIVRWLVRHDCTTDTPPSYTVRDTLQVLRLACVDEALVWQIVSSVTLTPVACVA